jgi:hypothetical protein
MNEFRQGRGEEEGGIAPTGTQGVGAVLRSAQGRAGAEEEAEPVITIFYGFVEPNIP